jgi:hypothetical protein
MGDVVSLKPDAALIGGRYHEVREFDQVGGRRLVIARFREKGGAYLAVLLDGMPEESAEPFLELARILDTDPGRHYIEVIASAVILGIRHAAIAGIEPPPQSRPVA